MLVVPDNSIREGIVGLGVNQGCGNSVEVSSNYFSSVRAQQMTTVLRVIGLWIDDIDDT